MSKLSICFVAYEFPPFYWTGGVGVYTAGLCDALLKQGHEVTVLTTDIKKSESYNTGRQPYFIFIDTINHSPFRLLSFYARAKAKIKKVRQNWNCEVVHYTTSYGGPVASRKDTHTPVIATMFHPYVGERRIYTDDLGRLMEHPTGFLKALVKDLAARKLCKKASKIIAISRFTAENIISDYSILPGKVEIIPVAVDIERFNPYVSGHHLREKWKLNSDPLVVYVGRLAPTKGLNYLIQAFANVCKYIADAKLLIVGEGSLKSELVKKSTKLNLKRSVKFAGQVPDEDLPYVYAAADLVVLPSFVEGFGLVLLEAMATSKPCVATTVGGIPEVVINGETGVLIQPGDSAALCSAICTVLEDRSLSRKLGEAGRRRVEKKFTWNVVANETAALYQQTLENSGHF